MTTTKISINMMPITCRCQKHEWGMMALEEMDRN